MTVVLSTLAIGQIILGGVAFANAGTEAGWPAAVHAFVAILCLVSAGALIGGILG